LRKKLDYALVPDASAIARAVTPIEGTTSAFS
jgi:hypothetical protein